jgi:protein-disulfide isomerase
MSKLSVPVSDKDHRQGDPDAPCTLVEYGDYQCPSCGHAYPIVKRVQKHFGKRLLFVFRNFPLSEMHPYAEPAAEAAEFAATHTKFWEMHDLLFENQDRLDNALLFQLAQQLHLDPEKLRQALASSEFEPRVRADFRGGVRSGVNGTPTFFINGQRHDGAYDYASLTEAIEGVLV